YPICPAVLFETMTRTKSTTFQEMGCPSRKEGTVSMHHCRRLDGKLCVSM
ncbi:MAG: hypothetical protein ACI8RD_009343, partial [Bacillariaceae sp.]